MSFDVSVNFETVKIQVKHFKTPHRFMLRLESPNFDNLWIHLTEAQYLDLSEKIVEGLFTCVKSGKTESKEK